MARVLLLSEQEARSLLFCAASAGHEVFVAGRGERNPSLRHHRMCREFVALENDLVFENASEDLAEEIAAAARQFDVDVIVYVENDPTAPTCKNKVTNGFQNVRNFSSHLHPTLRRTTAETSEIFQATSIQP